MKKFLKIVVILFVAGLVIGFGVYMYVFHKPHRNVAKEKPAFELKASDLLEQFSEKEDSCYKVYGDKALQISGKIAEISKKGDELTIILVDATTGVSCSFEAEYYKENASQLNALKVDDEVIIKGKCDGYDMIMGVVLTRCSLQ